MAPTAPTKRKPLRLKSAERLANPLLPRKVHRPDSAVTDNFLPTSKSDKRLIKHSSFVSRISKPAGSSSSSSSSSSRKAAKKNAKRDERHRAAATTLAGRGKKSLSTLDALADALPELSAAEVAGGAAEREGRVRHRSLRSTRGALKKRERVVKHEMDRFAVSLAQLQGVREEEPGLAAAAPTTHGLGAADTAMEGGVVEDKAIAPSAAANRFAALRGFIAATMEQNPAFATQKAKET